MAKYLIKQVIRLLMMIENFYSYLEHLVIYIILYNNTLWK